ncbi:MAG: YrzE family protein [Bacteroidales bacterium]|jgi:hypothetical protein|nr:YrzE family protein [Bacteroidales bacterium]
MNKVIVFLFGFLGLLIICSILLYFSEAQIPTISISSGIVAIISALIGVFLTQFLLNGQTDKESQKDKDIKIYENKIEVYSQFTSKMWDILDIFDTGKTIIPEDKLVELRKICFKDLVFYLHDSKQIIYLSEQIRRLPKANSESAIDAMSKITACLQENIIDSKKGKKTANKAGKEFENLYKSFYINADIKEDIQMPKGNVLIIIWHFLLNLYKSFYIDADKKEDIQIKQEMANNDNTQGKNITYWHFNALGEQQIQAFKDGNKDGNWFLSLIEYGEDWRTELLKNVKPNDVIFLFKRGGTGYIGAFKVLDTPNKIIEAKESYNQQEQNDIKKYDIYNGIDDGATLVSCLLVQPIAYNYKGIGCWSVRRRTIERINDDSAISFNLQKFEGNDLSEEQKQGMGKLDENTEVKNLDKEYFTKILNLQSQK